MTMYAGDYGEELVIDLGVPTANISVSMRVKKPDGTIATWAATPYGTTQIAYTTQEGDMPIAGIYTIMGVYSFGGTVLQHGAPIELQVYSLP